MPTILTAVNTPANPVFSGVYNPTSGPLGSHLFAQGDTTTVRPGLNENAGRSDLNARFGGGGYALVHGMALSAGAGLTLNIAAGQAQINSAVTYPGGTASLTNAGRNWIWISQAGAITVVFNSLTPPAGAQALVGSALTAAGAISSTDTSGVLELKGGMLRRTTADTTTPGDTPSAQLQFWAYGNGKTWFWTGTAYLDVSGVATPVSIANGGTGATTAAGARTALGVSREGQYAVTVNGNYSIAAADTTYSEIELSQGSVAAAWTFTFPSAASMIAAGTVAGHVWVIRNDTNFAVTLNHTGGSNTRFMPEQSQMAVLFDGSDILDVGMNYPNFGSLSRTANWTPSDFGETIKSLWDIEADSVNLEARFVSSTGSQRGRQWSVRSNQGSSTILTVKTAGATTDHDTLLLPGEISYFTMLGDGSLARTPSRAYTRRVALNFGSDADMTLTTPDFLAQIIEFTDTTPFLTTIRNVIFPLCDSKSWVVSNRTLQPLQFKGPSGLGVTVRPGKTAPIYQNGTSFFRADNLVQRASGSVEVIGATTSTATIANSTAEGSLIGTILQSNVLDADLLVPGRVIRVKAWGLVSTDATVAPTLTIRVKLGSVVVASGAIVMILGLANRLWEVECMITCRTRGATGTMFAQGRWYNFDAAVTGSVDGFEMSNTAVSAAIDTTSTQSIGLTAQWTVADTDNTISCSNCLIECLN